VRQPDAAGTDADQRSEVLSMDRHEKEAYRILANLKASRRDGRHIVYQTPGGSLIVKSRTPSDRFASRKFHADAKRAERMDLASQKSTSTSPIDPVPTPARRRHVIQNREQQVRNYDLLWSAGEDRSNPNGEDPLPFSHFQTLEDLLEEVKAVDGFWELDTCGRIRVLQTFAKEFTRVEIAAVRYSCCEIQNESISSSANEVKKAMDKIPWRQTMTNHLQHHGIQSHPALFLEDEHGDKIVLDVEGLRKASSRNTIAVLSATFDDDVFCAHWPVWDAETSFEDWNNVSPKRWLEYAFFNQRGFRNWGLELRTTAMWTDKSYIRPIIKELAARLNPQ